VLAGVCKIGAATLPLKNSDRLNARDALIAVRNRSDDDMNDFEDFAIERP